MREPEFIKEFSRQKFQDERDKLAHQIRAERKKYFDKKDEQKESITSIEQEVVYNQSILEKYTTELEQTTQRIEIISSSLYSKIKNLFEYIRLSKKIKQQTRVKESLEKKQEEKRSELESKQNIFNTLNISGVSEKALDAVLKFYDEQRKKWQQIEITPEDVEKYLNFEKISKLSLEEYVLFLKRFPQQMCTHVTRQGIRDHVGGVNHYAGFGKFWNGFKDILFSGKLRSWISQQVAEEEKKKQIMSLFNVEHSTHEEALNMLDTLCGDDMQGNNGSYADRSSVHLAAEEVASAHYGAETGNEIFFAYPSVLIGSRFVYKGQLSSAEGGTHNDQWVFSDEIGLPIDVAITFIPKDVRVDRKTGSKYMLDDNLEPIKDMDRVEKILQIVLQEGFKDFAKEYARIFGNTRINFEVVQKGDDILNTEQKEIKSMFLKAQDILKNRFNVSDSADIAFILRYEFLSLITNIEEEQTLRDGILQNLSCIGMEFKLAKDTISSEEYWEEYFKQQKTRPTKVVYYEGGDPTLALHNWRDENGLNKKNNLESLINRNNINLEQHDQIQQKLPHVSRFKNLARRIIDDFYLKN